MKRANKVLAFLKAVMYNVFVNEGGDPHHSCYQRQEMKMKTLTITRNEEKKFTVVSGPNTYTVGRSAAKMVLHLHHSWNVQTSAYGVGVVRNGNRADPDSRPSSKAHRNDRG